VKLHHKTPISFVLMLLANIVLIVVFEILVLYRFPAQLSAEMLAKTDSRYEGCHIYTDVNFSQDRGVHFFLVETGDGQNDLIPLRQHDFFPSRTRLLERSSIRDLDLGQDSSRQLLVGTNLFRITITNGQVHAMKTAGGGFQQAALAKYLGLGAVLAFLELLIWEKLRGN